MLLGFSMVLGTFDWIEIIYAVIGSFIGIFVPLWIDKIREKKQEKEERKKLVSSLDKELLSIHGLINQYAQPEYRYRIFFFSTFVWDSVVAAGLLPQMLSDSRVHCEKLIEIYADLALLRDLHEEFCRTEDREALIGIYESITAARTRISASIDAYRALDA